MQDPGRDAFAARFDRYVGELREVLARAGVRFGRAKDVAEVAQALSAPGRMREDADSVIRSIVAREGQGLSRAELRSIVVVATGGADLYGSGQEGSALQQIHGLVNGIWLDSRSGAEETSEMAAPTNPDSGTTPMVRQEVEAEADPDEARMLEQVASRAHHAAGLTEVPAQVHTARQSVKESKNGSETYFLKAEPDAGVKPEEKRVGGGLGRLRGLVAGLCVVAILVAIPLARRHPRAKVEGWGAQGGAATANAALSSLPASNRAQGGSGGSEIGVAGPGKGDAAEAHSARSVGDVRQGGSPAAAAATTVPPGVDHGSERKASAPAIPGTPHPSAPITEEAAPKPRHVATAIGSVAVAPAVGGRYVVSSGVMGGHLISAPQPGYPKMAKMWGIEGQVILQAVISSKGQVMATHVLDGHKMLRGSATNAVKKWRYRPYVVDGKATDIATVVIVEYKLKP